MFIGKTFDRTTETLEATDPKSALRHVLADNVPEEASNIKCEVTELPNGNYEVHIGWYR